MESCSLGHCQAHLKTISVIPPALKSGEHTVAALKWGFVPLTIIEIAGEAVLPTDSVANGMKRRFPATTRPVQAD